jgi:sterol desaturase/sphingolipid hydroxylase (fatty acid hydroxylase superfamily)
MEKYLKTIANSYSGYANYFWNEILNPSWHNYFYWLVASSFLIWLLEIFFPWRKNQPAIRQEFWLDIFYTFWNYFLFSLVIYNAFFNDFLGLFNIHNLVAVQLGSLPAWVQLLIIFIVRDFMQYNIHRLLHHKKWMWEFHKVHHSVSMMGFGALLRYHFMENIIYRSLEYIPLAMLGFGIKDFFIVHIFTLITGQLGHANLYLPLGKLKFLLNGPQMHLWHHAKNFPESHPNGFNYGITLSIWDYIFGTVYFPKNEANLPVGLPDAEHFPQTFIEQQMRPFKNLYFDKNNSPKNTSDITR